MKEKINLNLGCGVVLLKDFINIDNTFTLAELKSKKGIFTNSEIQKGAKFKKADMRKLPFKNDSVDYIECLEAIEHLPFKEVEVAIKEMHRVMKKNAKLVLFTTNFDDIAKLWTESITDKDFNAQKFFGMIQLMYGHQLTEGEYHRAAFNPVYMNGLMQACGFTKFKLVSYPRGSLPPKFKGAKWPKIAMGIGMLYIEATK